MTKRVRLPGGKWISKKLPESTPLRLQGFKPDEIWCMSDERKIVIYDMDIKHLLNAIKFVESRAEALMKANNMECRFDVKVFAKKVLAKEYPAYANMLKERDRRLSNEASQTTEEIAKHERDFYFQ